MGERGGDRVKVGGISPREWGFSAPPFYVPHRAADAKTFHSRRLMFPSASVSAKSCLSRSDAINGEMNLSSLPKSDTERLFYRARISFSCKFSIKVHLDT